MPIDNAKRELIQARVRNETLTALKAGQNVLISAPTGFGKTETFNRIAEEWLGAQPAGDKVLIVVDRKDIAEQNAARASARTSRPVSICIDGKMDQTGDLVYACSDTICNNLDQLANYPLVIIDEVHHAAEPVKSDDHAAEYSQILDAVSRNSISGTKNQAIGASATIKRSDGRPLHNAFNDALISVVTMQEAVNAGAIVPQQNAPPVNPLLVNGQRVQDVVQAHLDIQNPSKTIGGLNKKLRELRPDNYFETCVAAHLRRVKDPRTPTFAYINKIDDTASLLTAFSDRGVTALPYHSKMKKSALKNARKAFEDGQADVLVSVDMLTEGMDIPKVTALLIAKDGMSINEWVQTNGRAARAFQDKENYIVTDMGASTFMNGDMNARRLVEAYAANQKPTLGERAFTPWVAVDHDGAGAPSVYATHDGKKTIFAARQPETGEWHAFSKIETLTGPKRSRHTEITRFPNPANGLAAFKATNFDGIEKLGRMLVKANPNAFCVLAFQPPGPSLETIVKQSYSTAKPAIQRYISSPIPISQYQTTPKKISGLQR